MTQKSLCRMDDIPYHMLEYALVHDEGGDLIAQR